MNELNELQLYPLIPSLRVSRKPVKLLSVVLQMFIFALWDTVIAYHFDNTVLLTSSR